MELTIHKTECSCLEMPVRDILTLEQTQEIRVPDGFPDVGEILGAWGQMITRSKEWRSDEIVYNGGMMVWLLYQSEEGNGLHTLQTWVPFTAKWDIPEGTPEGQLRLSSSVRFVDARSASPRKIVVRCGMSALLEAYVKQIHEICLPEVKAEPIELLSSRFPVRLPKECGEKVFQVEESLDPIQPISDSCQAVYYTARPEITEQKVLANKIAFRGNTNLHLLCSGEDKKPFSMDFSLPFSQFAELEGSYSSDSQVSVMPLVTNLELETEDGKINVKFSIAAQYVVDDVEILNTAEDAYAIGRTVAITKEQKMLPSFLEKKTFPLPAQIQLLEPCTQMIDYQILPDFPKTYSEKTKVQIEESLLIRALYADSDGKLHGAVSKWEGKSEVAAGEHVRVDAHPVSCRDTQLMENGSAVTIRTELQIPVIFSGGDGIPMITGISVEQQKDPDPARPSIILRRAGNGKLWDIAKGCGSTIEAIQKTNGIDQEPSSGQMLIIPVF